MEEISFVQRPETYLLEDKYEKPKELFKTLAVLLRERYSRRSRLSILDAGCATGEFIYYLKKEFPLSTFTGIDTQTQFLERARTFEGLRGVRLIDDDVETFCHAPYDVISCMGVLSAFSDWVELLRNLIRNTKKGGRIYLASMFNDDDIDVWVTYRDNNHGPQKRTGQNIFSVHTISRFLESKVESFEFHPFEMPFDLEKHEMYPHRGWTVRLASGRRQVVSGLCILYHEKILEIRV